MTRRCTACAHPRHHEINLSIVDGVSFRAIAAWAGVSHMAVWRHKWHCLPELLAEAWGWSHLEKYKQIQTISNGHKIPAREVLRWEKDQRRIC